ncbi:MAG: hypothetical protein ACPGLV_00170, partial [Bacteroidia bacterium]
REVNIVRQDPFYVHRLFEFTPIGFNACYNKKFRVTLEWVLTDIDYYHTFTFPPEYSLNRHFSSSASSYYTRFKTFRIGASYKVYNDRRYSAWLGLSFSLYHNIFKRSDRFYSGASLNDGFLDENLYTESLAIEKQGAKRIWETSVFAKHIITFPRREFVFTTGVKLLPRQVLNVNYVYSTVNSLEQKTVEEIIRPSALLFINFSLERKIKLKHGDGRLKRLFGMSESKVKE